MQEAVQINQDITVSNQRPFTLFGGMNVLESREMAFDVAGHFVDVSAKLDVPIVFKASFDKANRSSVTSFRGPGIKDGLQILADIKAKYHVPIITDVHSPEQAARVAEVADVLQVPAFLARQTDLIVAVAETAKAINIKKPQFLAPQEMSHIMRKCMDAGNDKIMLCERGSCFGYNNLVVDMLGMDKMRALAPVIFDVTHALQQPGGQSDCAGGRRDQVTALARSGMALGIAGLFVEAHPNPDNAACDGPCALPLTALEKFLKQIKAVDDVVKGFSPIVTG